MNFEYTPQFPYTLIKSLEIKPLFRFKLPDIATAKFVITTPAIPLFTIANIRDSSGKKETK